MGFCCSNNNPDRDTILPLSRAQRKPRHTSAAVLGPQVTGHTMSPPLHRCCVVSIRGECIDAQPRTLQNVTALETVFAVVDKINRGREHGSL